MQATLPHHNLRSDVERIVRDIVLAGHDNCQSGTSGQAVMPQSLLSVSQQDTVISPISMLKNFSVPAALTEKDLYQDGFYAAERRS